jgi:hypothetical protein
VATFDKPKPIAEKKSPWRTVLIVFGIGAALAACTVGGCLLFGYSWFQENLPAMREAGERGQSSAREFAATHTQAECIDEGFVHHDACGTGMEIMCRAEARVFLTECLRQATPTPGICDGVPPRTEIMATANWAVAYCRDHGHAHDQQCGNFVAGITEYCAQP